MKWFLVIILSVAEDDGTIAKQEVTLKVAYSTAADCEVMAPYVATEYFEELTRAAADFKNIVVSYRCDEQKKVENAVWKKFKL